MANNIKRKGNQKPRIDIFKNGDVVIAIKTIELLEEYGSELLPWQKSIIYRWMAIDEDGKWVNSDCGLSVPRQNGKTELLIARIIGGMIFCNERIVYTAHSDNTVQEIKRRVQRFFYDAKDEIRNLLTDEFDKEPKSLDYIELRNGARCVFRTRTRTNGLGTTNDTLLIDEAQEYTDAQQEALLPTLASGKAQNQQTISVGTPPTAGTSGTVWVRTRQNVIDGKDDDMCWQEWSVKLLTDNYDENAWYETNPSLGYFLMLRAVKKEASKMSADSFNKMRLGWYAGVEKQRIITDEMWQVLAIDKVQLEAIPKMVYSVKFAPDGTATTLSVGVLMPNGKVHVEIIERRPFSDGLSWLSSWLLERIKKPAKIIIDGQSGKQLLYEELVRSNPRIKKKIIMPNMQEAGAAYGSFLLAIKNENLTHYNQGILNTAIRTAKKRDIGKDGLFGYATMNHDIQIDPVESVAFAYWGAVKFGNDVKPKTIQRIMV